MRNPLDDLVPLLAILVIFGAPMGVWMLSKIHAHTERMEMIRRGMAPPPAGMPRDLTPPTWQVPPPNMQATRRGGFYPQHHDDYFYAQRQLRRGIQVALIGFALLLGLSTIGPLSGNPVGPWLLGGLIPMFVGIAQIVNAVLNGARLPAFGAGAWSQQPTQFGPPPSAGPGPSAASPPPQAPSAPSAPYGWRPGSTPEIERPVQPPDQR